LVRRESREWLASSSLGVVERGIGKAPLIAQFNFTGSHVPHTLAIPYVGVATLWAGWRHWSEPTMFRFHFSCPEKTLTFCAFSTTGWASHRCFPMLCHSHFKWRMAFNADRSHLMTTPRRDKRPTPPMRDGTLIDYG